MSGPTGGTDGHHAANGYRPRVPAPPHPDEPSGARSARGWVEVLAAVLDALDLGVIAVRPHRHRPTHAVTLANAEARRLLGMTAGAEGSDLPAAVGEWLRSAGRRRPPPMTLQVGGRRVRVRRAGHLPAQAGSGWVLVVESLPAVAPVSAEVLRELYGLTPTQGVVLRALMAGASDKEIGQQLGGSSVSAVKKHVVAIRARVGASSRLEAVAIVGAALRTQEPGKQ